MSGQAGFPSAEPDGTLAFLREGYDYGRRRFDRLRTDAFTTRLLGRRVTITRGADAADMFYGGDRFGRDRAMPTSVVALLQDEGSVQSLNGAAHHHRKAIFISLISDEEALSELSQIFIDEWLHLFKNHGRVVLHTALINILTRTALRWVGLDPQTVNVPAIGDSLAAMIEAAGRFGPSNWITRMRRQHVERWARSILAHIRDAGVEPRTAVEVLASAKDADGSLLSLEVAAVELINVLRPTVAIGRFVVFAALALHRNPEWRSHLDEDPKRATPFVHEVRRFFPFFPVIGGRALREFSWHGHGFSIDDWVMLDLYATNHDARLWERPDLFSPERFVDWDGDPNTLIPQGAGDVATGHRCPGERATIQVMVDAVRLLSSRMMYRVPAQRLDVSLSRFPALPQSGFIMSRIEME